MIKPNFGLRLASGTVFISSIAVLSVANAADLPLAFPPEEPELTYEESFSNFPWDRYYVGLIAGFGQTSMDTTETLAALTFFDNNTVDMSGGLIGLTVGRNFQLYDNWVVGLELDGAFANIDGRKNGPSSEYIEADLNGILTARARLGYAFGEEKRFLPFVTAGLAAGHYEVGAYGGVTPGDPDLVEGNAVEEADWLFGYTLGAGLEYLVSEGISVKADYLYMNFGGSITTDPVIPQVSIIPVPIEFHPDDVHLWRLGVNLTY